MTKAAMLSIQGHYGNAIRSNPENVIKMSSDIWGMYLHRRGNHSVCSSWCPGNPDSGQNPAEADKHKLPGFVMDIIRPVFEELSKPELLEKCAHGGTQNFNEAFHHLVWSRAPKKDCIC